MLGCVKESEGPRVAGKTEENLEKMKGDDATWESFTEISKILLIEASILEPILFIFGLSWFLCLCRMEKKLQRANMHDTGKSFWKMNM